MKRLGQLGVCFAQGYYIASPRPVAEIPEIKRAGETATMPSRE
jgi:EAL domain-containing protein (putative c-di-GMP-specific phosphodiesterase class I)